MVKKDAPVNIIGELEREVVRILRDVPGVALAAGDGGHDIVLDVRGIRAIVEVKARETTNAAVAQQLIAYAETLPESAHLILVARSITADARQKLAEAGVGFMDATGAMHVELPGIFLRADGEPSKRVKQTERSVRLAGKAGVAATALLLEPDRLWKVNDLADESGVSAGLAHRLLARLERESLVHSTGVGPQKARSVVNPAGLLDLWAEEAHDVGVRRLRAYRLSRDPRTQTAAVSRALSEAGIDHAVTAAAAAARLAPFITALPVVDIWLSERSALEDAAQAVGADEVVDGHNLVFRSARDDTPLALRFRRDRVWLANLFRVYIDLRADPRRGREQAERLRQEVIGF